MGLAKRKLQEQFERENKPEKLKEDVFYCGVNKFKKMLRVVALMRGLQDEYFKTKDQDTLKKTLAIESKVDKAIKFYRENEGKLHDCPFTDA